jgi:Subtilase family
VSPNVTAAKKRERSPIAARVLEVRSLAYKERKGATVIAHSEELIVHTGALRVSRSFRVALNDVADRVGSLAQLLGPPPQLVRPQPGQRADPNYKPDPTGPLSEVEIWRLKPTTTGHSLDVSPHLRRIAEREGFSTPDGLPAVHPHHVAILSPAPGGCPATPPKPAGAPKQPFVQPPSRKSTAKVTVLDSGYIWIDPPHRNLDKRVTVLRGQWLDTATGKWQPDQPDEPYTDPSGELDGISGHGTFIAGLISHIAPRTRLEVVGLRNQEVEIGPLGPRAQLRLFETEVAIAHAMLRRCRTDVIQCGFAFPTLDDYPSLPFAAVMKELRSERAPHGGRVAVVAPAGNETSRRPFWPAALPGVIGVAATNPRGTKPAWFSNWGDWCDCCAGGENVYSTFVRWPLNGAPRFRGWATWNGTSFSAPKVSAEIARRFAAKRGSTTPADIANQLIAGTKSRVADATGLTLPYLQI